MRTQTNRPKGIVETHDLVQQADNLVHQAELQGGADLVRTVMGLTMQKLIHQHENPGLALAEIVEIAGAMFRFGEEMPTEPPASH